jgi:hypothetical protein
MRDYKNIQKMLVAFGLMMTFLLPGASLVKAKTNTLPSSAKRVGNKDEILKFSKLADSLITNCSNLDGVPRPSGEQLKRCLTISKELRDRMTAFLGSLDTLVQLFKNKKLWGKEFDERFIKVASQHGVDAETIQDIKRAGGLSLFYQNSVNDLRSSKSAIDAEIKELEAQVKSAAAVETNFFQKVSFERRRGLLGVAKKIAKVAKKVAIAIIAACEASGGFCD